MDSRLPFVSVIVPTLNEAAYVERCLTSLASQVPPGQGEILVVDGGSTDGTPDIVRDLQARIENLRLLMNPKRLQSAAVNLGAVAADPEATVLLRADAHADYPADFVATCLRALRDHHAQSVVVPMVAVGRTVFQKAAAAAQNSRLGNGGAPHRAGRRSGPVDHGHHAAFDRAFFRRVGGYDETFSHNEDAELDARIRRAGGLIWLETSAPVIYYPRSRPAALARQYYAHGRGRARTLLKHGGRPAARQLIPPAVLVASVGALALAPLWPPALALPLAYAGGAVGYGMAEAARRGDPAFVGAGPAALVMHMCWAAGFLAMLARRPRPEQSQQAADEGVGRPSHGPG